MCTPDAYILFYQRRDILSSASTESIPKSLPSEQQINSIVGEFDNHLNLDHSSTTEDQKSKSILQPPLPLPRKLLTSSPVQDQCASAPCPMPRTRVPQYETQAMHQPEPAVRRQVVRSIPQYVSRPTESSNDSNFGIGSPWSRFNNHRYSNDDPQSNVIYPATSLR